MPELILTCARCQRQLRVPEEMQGRLVKCPACEFTFTVSPEAAQAHPPAEQPAPPRGEREDFAFAPFREFSITPPREAEYDSRRSQARAALMAPAICLLITSGLALVGSAVGGLFFFRMPEGFREQWIQQTVAQMRNDPRVNPAQIPEMIDAFIAFGRLTCGVGLVVSPLVVLASILMLRARGYWVAVMGSFLAMLDIGCGCCLLGLPFGIWSLVVLLRPETKELFYQ
jgi:hypothetical protein